MYKMNICNKPSNKTAPEKSVWTAPAQASGPSPELHGQRSRRNGWSWPPHPLQIVAWLLYLFFAVIGFGVLVPLLPHHWVPTGYACMGVIFAGHLVVHLTAVSIDPADANVRDKSYAGPLPIFNRSQHAHVIEDLHCNLCDVDVCTIPEQDPIMEPLLPASGCAALREPSPLEVSPCSSTRGSTRSSARRECALQALQCLQQMRVRLRPPLQVAQQLRGREELPPCLATCSASTFTSCGTSSPPMSTSCSTVHHRRQKGPTGSLSRVTPRCDRFSPSRFLATGGQVEHSRPSSDTLTLPPRIRPQKKRKRRMYKVPRSGILDRESPLPRLRGLRVPGRHSSSSTDSSGASPVHAAGPAGAYHSASAESMDEIPVAQTRLGSAALAAPGSRGRETGLALQARAPAVFVSPSSGEPGTPGGREGGLP
ncbi:palmitoyltransferase ZDHHC1 isoform X4 [Sciurus carolinensis]|uniref:palmitoyltransferase ZDHHC1 isoform X4 n=1 Tax=Sciurus carolinensis TaxID=30640 RepID=UPI001FB50C60|nr:palmitoyltransferase ZDHHC1 isoform X4 [Sciurus carolinensis]